MFEVLIFLLISLLYLNYNYNRSLYFCSNGNAVVINSEYMTLKQFGLRVGAVNVSNFDA